MPAPRPGAPVRGSTTGRPIMAVFDLLGRRWTARILWELRAEHLGFRALQSRCDAMSSSVLRDRLQELVEVRLVGTDDDGQYGLTRQGLGLIKALAPLNDWAARWRPGPGR